MNTRHRAGSLPAPAVAIALAAVVGLGGLGLWSLLGRREAPRAVGPLAQPGARASQQEHQGDQGSSAPRSEAGTQAAPDAAAASLRASSAAALGDLAAAVERGDEAEAQRLAAVLRRALREDPAALAAAGALLRDEATDPRTRGALAFVLGSLGTAQARAELVAALGADPAPDPDVTRWLIYALGAWDERPDFDERFGFAAGGPWVAEGPAGLRMPIRARIDDPAALALLERALLDAAQPDVRQAAVETLRHSLGHDGVREAFEQALERETDAHAHALCAEALAGWTLEAPDAETATALRARLIEQARAGDRDVLRLRIAPAFTATALTPGEIGTFTALAGGAGGDFDTRSFALTVLGAQLAMQGEEAAAEADAAAVRAQLAQILARDPNAKLREQSAAALGREANPASASVLAAALAGDGAWHVRIVCAQALGPLLRGPAQATARQALDGAAAGDPDERVRAAAARLLGR